MIAHNYPLLPPPAQPNRALALNPAPRAVIVYTYTPPIIVLPPRPQALAPAQERDPWLDVWMVRLPNDKPGYGYIATDEDLAPTIRREMRRGMYVTLQMQQARMLKSVYDRIPEQRG